MCNDQSYFYTALWLPSQSYAMILNSKCKAPALAKQHHTHIAYTQKGDRRTERPDVLIAVVLKIQVFWDVAPC